MLEREDVRVQKPDPANQMDGYNSVTRGTVVVIQDFPRIEKLVSGKRK